MFHRAFLVVYELSRLIQKTNKMIRNLSEIEKILGIAAYINV